MRRAPMTGSGRLRNFWLAGLALGLSLPLFVTRSVSAEAEGPQSLERELVRHAPRIVHYLREQGYHNVGVLKFRAKRQNEPISDNIGTLNMNVARRLEVALLLANSKNQNDGQLGIIRNASAVAKTAAANHLSDAGRKRLFQAKYKLAWGDDEVAADAFLTGVVCLDKPERGQMTVFIRALARDSDKFTSPVPSFTAAMDLRTLDDAGISYDLRGLFDKPKASATKKEKQDLVVQTAQASADAIKEGTKPSPATDKTAPVELEIQYDGQPVKVEPVQGKAQAPPFQQGQRISLIVRKRNADDKETYGVVVKVNGRNTLFEEILDAALCRKWILRPDHPEIQINGFSIGEDKTRIFEVSSPEESKQNEVNYGSDVGTISMIVFRSQSEAPPIDLPKDRKEKNEARQVAAVERGTLPDKPAKNAKDLQESLANEAVELRGPGLLEAGALAPDNLVRVPFNTDPVPVMSVTISYYQRQGKP